MKGNFQRVLDDPHPPKSPKKIILCSGKVSYDLFSYREKNKINNTSIIRLEQLYPFPEEPILKILKQNDTAKKIYWVQEEPKNMGAWNFISTNLQEILPPNYRLHYVGRLASASIATGSYSVHVSEQNLLIKQAFE